MLPSSHAIEAMYTTGHWLLGQQRASHAAEVFRLMTVTAPDDERSWLGLGAAHEALGQLPIAAELYRLSLTLGPFARCTLARARVLVKLGDTTGSETCFDAALEAARELGATELEAMILADRRMS